MVPATMTAEAVLPMNFLRLMFIVSFSYAASGGSDGRDAKKTRVSIHGTMMAHYWTKMQLVARRSVKKQTAAGVRAVAGV
jgi:hypothetical protein